MEKRTSLVIVQLIHRLMQTDIRCTTTARLFYFPLLVYYIAFLMRECLHDGTKKLLIQLDCRDACALVAHLSNTFPNRYLVDLATMFPNLKTVRLPNWRGLERDIPAPWNKGKYNTLTRD